MEKHFVNILDDDEVIIKTYKPDKFKYYLVSYLIYVFVWIMLSLPMLMIVFIPDDDFDISLETGLTIYSIAFLLVTIVSVILINKNYNKRLYAYTNKRILIQSGIIGVDYKGLDHKMIGATEVRVDLFDKLANKNTGTLKFGSQASPMNQQGPAMFVFSGIKEPYEVYKEIKKFIDSVKG